MTDLRQAPDTARAIAAAALGRDAGSMTAAESSSRHAYTCSDVAVIQRRQETDHRDPRLAFAPHST
jgi:hypothetical protein